METNEMKKVTYFEKLKDPRWQQKRLEIFSRDNFNCQLCHDETSPLHIHHKNYFFNLDPWEYKNEDLITLCENCHQQETLLSQTISKEILIFLKRNFSMYDLYMFNNTLKDMNNISFDYSFQMEIICKLLEDKELAEKLFFEYVWNEVTNGK